MDLVLKRTNFSVDGIFGRLETLDGKFVAYTLEHAYSGASGWEAKTPRGVYKCVRGQHRLAHMTHDFTTYELSNVQGHDNILFHVGNYNSDSEGCILLGETCYGKSLGYSQAAFNAFMNLQLGLDNFTLTVQNESA